jgi:aminoglycoside phosphotransferase (APT) family kinase protein
MDVAALDERLPGTGPLVLEPLPAGHSNLTLVVRRRDTDDAWVLRSPPPGVHAPGAHDVLREARVLRALADSRARVPRVVLLDEAGPYYVMERAPGQVVRSDVPPFLRTAPARSRLAGELVDALVEIHAADVAPLIEGSLGRPGGYLDRQMHRWSGQWTTLGSPAARSQAIVSTARRLETWLRNHQPTTPEHTVVHGDYKLDNVVVDPSDCSITAVLDWEMATVGDPLSDLGYLLFLTPWVGEAQLLDDLTGDALSQPGSFTRDNVLDRYATSSGRDVSAVRWHEVLAGWKLACFLETSHRRWLRGESDDEWFATLDTGVPRLLHRALDLSTGAG